MLRHIFSPLKLFWGIVIFDQMLKIMVKMAMTPRETIPLFPGVFHLTYVLNPGAAFGLWENARFFFVGTGILVLLGAAFVYPKLRCESAWLRYGIIALLGGTVGNLIDRIYNGLVVDYLDFRFWPVFNLADIAIVAGAVAVIYAIMFKDNKTPVESTRLR